MTAGRSPLWKRIKRGVTLGLASGLGPACLRLLAASWRVRREGQKVLISKTPDQRLPVFALWHACIPMGVLLHRGQDLAVMISRHHDGEVVSRIVERFGFRTARGSTFDGSMAATREMLRIARSQTGLVLTPDGPRGPARSVAPGAVWLAAASGRPLVPTVFEVSRAWHTSSWDRMVIPRPFARVAVVYSDGLQVSRDALRTPEGRQAELARVEAEFARLEKRAQDMLACWEKGGG